MSRMSNAHDVGVFMQGLRHEARNPSSPIDAMTVATMPSTTKQQMSFSEVVSPSASMRPDWGSPGGFSTSYDNGGLYGADGYVGGFGTNINYMYGESTYNGYPAGYGGSY